MYFYVPPRSFLQVIAVPLNQWFFVISLQDFVSLKVLQNKNVNKYLGNLCSVYVWDGSTGERVFLCRLWGSGLCQWLLGLSYSCLPGHEPGQLLGQERPQHPHILLEGDLWPRLLNPAS